MVRDGPAPGILGAAQAQTDLEFREGEGQGGPGRGARAEIRLGVARGGRTNEDETPCWC